MDKLEVLYRERFDSFARIALAITGDVLSASDAFRTALPGHLVD